MGEVIKHPEHPTGWSVRYKKWICINGNHTCVAKPKGRKTYPCTNCDGYRLPPRKRKGKPPGPKPNLSDRYAFRGKWVPRGGILVPVFDEGLTRENANK